MASVVDFSPSVSGNGSSSPHLTRKERDLLLYLRRNSGKCLSRTVLLQEVWGYREGVRSRTLDVHVQRLRKKLGPAEGAKILTVFRGGYLWATDNGGAGVRAPVITQRESAAAD
jgi:DNA-binding response OmpR family regulator